MPSLIFSADYGALRFYRREGGKGMQTRKRKNDIVSVVNHFQIPQKPLKRNIFVEAILLSNKVRFFVVLLGKLLAHLVGHTLLLYLDFVRNF